MQQQLNYVELLFTLLTVLCLVTLAVVSLVILYRRSCRRGVNAPDSGTCRACGYAVRGIESWHCPECGADLRRIGIEPPHPPRTSSRARPIILATSLVLVMLLWLAGAFWFTGVQSRTVVQRATVHAPHAHAPTSSRAQSLTYQLQLVRSQLNLYQRQHKGNYPPVPVNNMGGFSWEEMTGTTDPTGLTSGAEWGPYIQTVPRNPFVTANDWSKHWGYNPNTGEFYAVLTDAEATTFDIPKSDYVTTGGDLSK